MVLRNFFGRKTAILRRLQDLFQLFLFVPAFRPNQLFICRPCMAFLGFSFGLNLILIFFAPNSSSAANRKFSENLVMSMFLPKRLQKAS